jgi:cobalt/nickel transport system ATP-binding protein
VFGCEDLWVSLPTTGEVLKGVSLVVNKGEIVALLGPNGSGKTTLILALAGLLNARSGKVTLEGVELRLQLPEARRRIGVLFQDPDDQLFNPTVMDELMFTLDQLGLPPQDKERRVKEVASLLNIEHILHRPVYSLSFGEKRRVALASILVYDPEYLLLDEPTANIDPGNLNIMLKVVCSLRKAGKGILLATQAVDLVNRLASRVYVMNEGRIIWSGGPEIPEEVLVRAGLKTGQVACQ